MKNSRMINIMVALCIALLFVIRAIYPELLSDLATMLILTVLCILAIYTSDGFHPINIMAVALALIFGYIYLLWRTTRFFIYWRYRNNYYNNSTNNVAL